jgi:hypothetical protein
MLANMEGKMRKIAVGILMSGFLLGMLFTFTGFLFGKKEKKVYKVAVKLEKVEREPEMTSKGKVQDGQVFDSGSLAVAWSPVPQGFRFRIYNKTTSTLTILWNECKFTDEKGNNHNISHKGVKRVSSNDMEMKVLKPTVVQPGANWQDVFFPYDSDYIKQEKELVGFSTGAGSNAVNTYGRAGLRIRPIFIHEYKKKQIKKIAKKQKKKGKDFSFEKYINSHTYGVAMVVKLDETKYVYRFLFRAHLLAEQ